MSIVTKEITVDLTRKQKTRVIFAKQLDNDCRRLLVSLTDSGKEFIVPQSAVASVSVLRPDGESRAVRASVTEDGRIEAILGSWTLGVAGETKCSFTLYFENDKRLSSPEIILEVGEELYVGSDISSDYDYPLLSSLISDCSEILSAEAKRVSAEAARSSEEQNRIASEETRANMETVRIQKETQRAQGEQARKAAESQRSTAENQRIDNENTRIEAENQRNATIGALDTTLDYIVELQEQLLNGEPHSITAYPVGSIYMSVNSTSPASLFGGTWERLQDKFLLGAGSYSETNGNEGGDATHTLTADEMPKHSHNINYSIASSHTQQAAGFLHNPETHSGFSGEGTYAVWSQSVGKGTPHNNMPPYLAVYMWQRTA